MLHIDSFTNDDYRRMAAGRGEALSIYLPTTPISRYVNENRIRFKTLADEAADRALAAGFASAEQARAAFAAMADDYVFWSNQAHGLAVFSMDGVVTAVRLGYPVAESVEIGDRLHLKPMLPALDPKLMWVLTISDDGAQLYRTRQNRTLEEVDAPGMPESLRLEMGDLIERPRGETNRLTSGEGYAVRQRQFLKAIDEAVEPVMRGSGMPLVVVATQEQFGVYRALNTYPLLAANIARSPVDTHRDVILDHLDAIERDERMARVRRWERMYEERRDQRRTVSEVQQISRLIEGGQIETMLVCQDSVKYGAVADDGTIAFAERGGGGAYDVYDDIVRRAMATGVTILPLRSDERSASMLRPMAATLRWPQ